MRMRVTTTVALAVVLAGSLRALAASGLVELRACVPTGHAMLEAHLAFLRPVDACPTGVGLDDGAVAVVCSLALTTIVAWSWGLTGAGTVGLLARRAGALVRRVLDAVLPGRRVPRVGGPVRVARSLRTPRPRVVRRTLVSGAVVAWRGPPALAA
ncbi:hypothetical protein [Miniimonas arenae]|uniref:hypothetical protein n=1 Tax=Miniimonas arenae TaxID=676201 RepID=UPI0015D5B280|nr:hypothetical protein [Miniimonas arenae]